MPIELLIFYFLFTVFIIFLILTCFYRIRIYLFQKKYITDLQKKNSERKYQIELLQSNEFKEFKFGNNFKLIAAIIVLGFGALSIKFLMDGNYDASFFSAMGIFLVGPFATILTFFIRKHLQKTNELIFIDKKNHPFKTTLSPEEALFAQQLINRFIFFAIIGLVICLVTLIFAQRFIM